jgi:spermidine synthase
MIFITDRRGFTIITRSGIEKIQLDTNIQVEYDVIVCDLDNVVIKGYKLFTK